MVSKGIAFGSPEPELGEVLNRAGQAMYLATDLASEVGG